MNRTVYVILEHLVSKLEVLTDSSLHIYLYYYISIVYMTDLLYTWLVNLLDGWLYTQLVKDNRKGVA